MPPTRSSHHKPPPTPYQQNLSAPRKLPQATLDYYSIPGEPEWLKVPRYRPNPVTVRRYRLRLKDIRCIKVLGAGGSGSVCLARTKRKDSPLFAIKVMGKTVPREHDVQGRPGNKDRERSILTNLEWNPFIAGLIAAFDDPKALYLVLEYIPGPTLTTLIQQTYLKPAQVRFYFAVIVVAVQYLHDNGVLHRDLKPDNILIGSDGYPVLTDFGSADTITGMEEDTTWEDDYDGTIQFMAPERLESDNEKPSCSPCVMDWWSVGCILFQMLSEWPAFCFPDDDQENFPQTKRRIKDCQPSAAIESLVCTRLCKDMLQKLLYVDACRRMGANGGQNEIANHPWVSDINWYLLSKKGYPAPKTFPASVHDHKSWHTTPLDSVLGVEHHVKPLAVPVDRFCEVGSEAEQ